MPNLSFPILTNDRYQSAVNEAENNARKHLRKPDFSQFSNTSVQKYPAWFSRLIGGLLLAVLVFSFWVSAGKQIATAGMVFDGLPEGYQHLASGWSSWSIVAMLLLSEFGAILFLVAAGTVASSARALVIRGRQVAEISAIFRLFAFLCALFAVVANISITALDPVPQVAVYQWLIAIGVPSIVLGLGILAEQIIIDSLKTRATQTAAFNVAMADHERLSADPTLLPDWGRYLGDSLWRELNRYKDAREALILAGDDPTFKNKVLVAEYQAQRNGVNFLLTAGGTGTDAGTDDGTAMDRAKNWLAAHDGTTLTVRQMADQAGVSVTTMQRARKEQK